MVAYLDNNEDGKISIESMLKFFKKERLFEYLSEREVDNLLDPITVNGSVNVVSFINLMENKNITNNNKDNNDDDMNNDGLIIVEYDFSNDPETRALEKKMRDLGRVLAKKGLDVEALFKKFDTRESGMIRRTEFIEIMSKMGLYILETGKVLEDAINDGNDVRKQQLTQINKLKGIVGGTSYSQNAARLARSYVMNSGDTDRGGDFKEHLESMALINWYRQSQKKLLLQKVLSHSLASTIRIYPRFGKTLFFEHPITNPFGHEERFIIDVNDPELRLVTSFDEWLHLRQSSSPHVGALGEEPVEAEMFDRDADGNVQVILLPHETLHIPFTFMTLLPFTPQDMENKTKLIKNKMNNNNDNKSEAKDNNSSSSGADVVLDEEEPRRAVEVRVISGNIYLSMHLSISGSIHL
jgi:Ca2+-binding EF-hand superfamily protein